MPVSPESARNLAKEVLAIYATAEETLLEKIARRLAKGIDEPGWADRKLLEIQQLRREVEQVITGLTAGSDKAVEEALRIAYNRGTAAAGADMKAAGIPDGIAFGGARELDVEALVKAAQGRLDSTHLRIRRSAADIYTDVIHQSAGQVVAGTVTRREAAQAALARYARSGITGFVDKAGRGWDLPTYAEMSTRTAAAQAAVQGHVDQLAANGMNLVMVSNAPEECSICRPWEGKVLALTSGALGSHSGRNFHGSGTVTVTVTATLGEATDAGLFHANCRHAVSMFQPGITKPMTHTADPEGDKLRQRQRELERRVRRAKKQELVEKEWAQSYVDKWGSFKAGDQYGQKVKARLDRAVAKRREAQQGLSQFIDDHDRKNLRYRTSLKAR